MRNKTTAALLAFFLGGFGGQYFYLGRAGAGIASILFCWTFIPCFIALYHFIKFLTMSDEAFNREYNREYMLMAAMPVQVVPVTHTLASAPAAPAVRNIGSSAASVASSSAGTLTDELERLFALKEKGALTEEEYIVRKAKILA